MSTEQIKLSNQELDTIGEVMNISMGSAATAISTMLDRPVNITTPQLRQDKLSNVDCSELEPAIMVKINYVEGVDGTNVILLRRRDMQVILNLLMGNDDFTASDDFEFDEMSMSAACEVMNQMMGASATALSEVLGFPINISTPESMLIDKIEDVYKDFGGADIDVDAEVVAISFEMDISNILNTTFTSFWPIEMAKKMVDTVMKGVDDEPAAASPAPQQPAASAPTPMAPPAAPQAAMPAQPPIAPPMVAPEAPQQPAMGAMLGQPPMPGMPPMQPDMSQQQMGMAPGYGYPPQPPMPGYGYPPQPMQYPPMYGYPSYPQPAPEQNINVQKAEFPAFNPNMGAKGFGDSNLNLLMNIPLEVSVVIGKTKRKIKDIMEFGQGSVVELDKQTGAPAEIIVNGQLLAYGDIVVVDDNFAVRVTEIVGAEELIQSLTGKS